MAIRLNTALATGLLAAAALTLGCSERQPPLAGVLADVSTSSATQATSYSGRATVLQATVLGFPPVVLADAGSLPPSGGAQEASLLNASVPGLLTAEVLHASTVGQGNASRSEASVAELSLTVAGNTVSAGLLQARASAVCGDGGATATGSSNITALSVNGQTVTISGMPNQRVPLLVGEVIINEQTSNGAGDITVNALHIAVPGVADVIVSSAHADITCQPAPPPPVCAGADFVTGGGWITGTPSGAKANFGVAGGIKQGQFWGHLTYIDHGPNGPRVKGTGVTVYNVELDHAPYRGYCSGEWPGRVHVSGGRRRQRRARKQRHLHAPAVWRLRRLGHPGRWQHPVARTELPVTRTTRCGAAIPCRGRPPSEGGRSR